MKALNTDYLQAVIEEENKKQARKNRRNNPTSLTLDPQQHKEGDENDNHKLGSQNLAFRKDAMEALN